MSSTILELVEWYEAHEDAEDAISPLVSVLITALLDAGYDKEYTLEIIDTCWDTVERKIDQWEADNASS